MNEIGRACFFRVMRIFFFYGYLRSIFFKKTELADKALHSKTVDILTQERREHTHTHKYNQNVVTRPFLKHLCKIISHVNWNVVTRPFFKHPRRKISHEKKESDILSLVHAMSFHELCQAATATLRSEAKRFQIKNDSSFPSTIKIN